MLGLVGTVAGAAALEIKRLRKRGSVEEVKEYKKKERELRQMLEATHLELEKVKEQSEVKVHQLEAQLETQTGSLKRDLADLEQKAAHLGQQKVQLQQNNTKLVLTNLMLMNKAKQLEDNSRALVAKQEDLQHQLEQLQRDQQAATASFELSLSALKEQVTGVLNRYFSKELDLQAAMHEMQALGIEVVNMDELHRHGDTMEFETKLVLDSPMRMQRLMSAASNARSTLQLPSIPHDKDVPKVPQLSFPMGISTDPATGAPRITLAWRTDTHAAGALPAGPSDSQQRSSDQQQPQPSKVQQLALTDSAKAGAVSAKVKPSSSGKVAIVQDTSSGSEALTFTAAQKQKTQNSGFSLGFGFGRKGSSSGGGSGTHFDGPALLSAGTLKSDDDMFISSNSKDLIGHGSRR
ncbi:hypothetical protein OEZ85_009489 [Tetradesmus obliquus]|uniref:Uncharacterized protein n=1 Tax=Tetradesmus obliquus TaxID=3088 RepID=A0ABY8UC99_TETOB|nr:hypothetical protein OEZ85_009489 [Tetradesmus obliquus]